MNSSVLVLLFEDNLHIQNSPLYTLWEAGFEVWEAGLEVAQASSAEDAMQIMDERQTAFVLWSGHRLRRGQAYRVEVASRAREPLQ